MKTILALLLLVSTPAWAGAEVRLEGVIDSITDSAYLLRSGSRVYSLDKDRLTEETRKLLERPAAKHVVIRVPMRAIVAMREVPPAGR